MSTLTDRVHRHGPVRFVPLFTAQAHPQHDRPMRMREMVKGLVLAAGMGCGGSDAGESLEPSDAGGAPSHDASVLDGGEHAVLDGGEHAVLDGGEHAVLDGGEHAALDGGEHDAQATDLDGGGFNDASGGDSSELGDAAAPDAGWAALACGSVATTGAALLDLSHASGISSVAASEGRIASRDSSGHWVLRDANTGAVVTQGDGACSSSSCPLTLSGDLLALAAGTELELRGAADGALRAKLTLGATPAASYGLAADGSYVWTADATGLRISSPTGSLLVMRAGAYQAAQIAAGASALRVANGPAGSDVIEKIEVPSGNRTSSAAFLGTFKVWFADGSRFITATGTTVRIYSSEVVQQRITNLASVQNIAGYGRYFWTYDSSSPGYAFRLYDIAGGDPPVLMRNLDVSTSLRLSRSWLAILPSSEGRLQILDLSDDPPAPVSYDVPTAYLKAFAATSDTDWVVGDDDGVLFQRRLGLSEPRALGCGEVAGVALSSSGAWAISTSANQILIGDVTSRTISHVIPFRADKLRLVATGDLLVARADQGASQYQTDRSVRIYDLVDSTHDRVIASSYSAASRYLFDFELSQNGERIAETWRNPLYNGAPPCDYRVTDRDGGSPLLTTSTPRCGGWALSPNGRRAALSDGTYDLPTIGVTVATNIYLDGSLTGAVEGYPLTWIDDQRLLIKRFTWNSPYEPTVTAFLIVDPAGATLASPALPSTQWATALPGGTQILNTLGIYDVATATQVWSPPEGGTGATAAANDTHVLYTSGARVLLVTHP